MMTVNPILTRPLPDLIAEQASLVEKNKFCSVACIGTSLALGIGTAVVAYKTFPLVLLANTTLNSMAQVCLVQAISTFILFVFRSNATFSHKANAATEQLEFFTAIQEKINAVKNRDSGISAEKHRINLFKAYTAVMIHVHSRRLPLPSFRQPQSSGEFLSMARSEAKLLRDSAHLRLQLAFYIALEHNPELQGNYKTHLFFVELSAEERVELRTAGVRFADAFVASSSGEFLSTSDILHMTPEQLAEIFYGFKPDGAGGVGEAP